MKSIMKKIFSVTMMLCISMCCMFAQSEVIKFLGIPVDGTKEEMIQKLKAKGFKSSIYGDLEGEFNGTKVYIGIVTNKNVVSRIGLVDAASLSEDNIKIRFNTLCQQFENNPKYTPIRTNQCIPENEDISYQMSLYKKRYEAGYIQQSDPNNVVWFLIKEQYPSYQIIMFYENLRNQANGEDL